MSSVNADTRHVSFDIVHSCAIHKNNLKCLSLSIRQLHVFNLLTCLQHSELMFEVNEVPLIIN